eukprot:749482-Hanusia_phi.AAC.2
MCSKRNNIAARARRDMPRAKASEFLTVTSDRTVPTTQCQTTKKKSDSLRHESSDQSRRTCRSAALPKPEKGIFVILEILVLYMIQFPGQSSRAPRARYRDSRAGGPEARQRSLGVTLNK